jgi:signal-transduction protein with cAMP-binding, CBS, and nucleotidyltransferase domain
MLNPEEKEMQALAEVADYMARAIKTVSPETTIQEAGQVMAKFNIGSLLVVKGGEYAGIITETDLARKGMAKGINPEKTTVQALMSAPIISIESHKAVEEAHALMKAKGIRHLGVTEAGKIVGLVSLSDLIRYYASYFQMSE